MPKKKAKLEEIHMKVVSYCDIPEEIIEDEAGGWLEQASCDSYITYTIDEPQESLLDKWIAKTYPELIGQEFMIHID